MQKNTHLRSKYQVIIILLLISFIFPMAIHSQESKSDNSPFKLYTLMVEDFYQLTKSEGAKWQSAVDDLDLEQVLVMSELQTEQDYQKHGAYLTNYIEATHNYKNFLENLEAKTEEHMVTFGLTAEQVKPVVEKLLSTYNNQRETLLELMSVHLQYGKQMNKFLKFLQDNHDKWSFKQGKMDIENKKVAKKFNKFIDQMIASEDSIEVLIDQLNSKL